MKHSLWTVRQRLPFAVAVGSGWRVGYVDTYTRPVAGPNGRRMLPIPDAKG
ncbi:hypothetical protein [Micromonospora chalcea]|uniref:hypothetical protein n=1 Tax=Micromonospora chalcea TaxID=1874 RepID=UPI00381A324D